MKLCSEGPWRETLIFSCTSFLLAVKGSTMKGQVLEMHRGKEAGVDHLAGLDQGTKAQTHSFDISQNENNNCVSGITLSISVGEMGS